VKKVTIQFLPVQRTNGDTFFRTGPSPAKQDIQPKFAQLRIEPLEAASTAAPTEAPTEAPAAAPTDAPTETPTEAPAVATTTAPTETPTDAPTEAPTTAPTAVQTDAPTDTTDVPLTVTTAVVDETTVNTEATTISSLDTVINAIEETTVDADIVVFAADTTTTASVTPIVSEEVLKEVIRIVEDSAEFEEVEGVDDEIIDLRSQDEKIEALSLLDYDFVTDQVEILAEAINEVSDVTEVPEERKIFFSFLDDKKSNDLKIQPVPVLDDVALILLEDTTIPTDLNIPEAIGTDPVFQEIAKDAVAEEVRKRGFQAYDGQVELWT
jgi:hypothetical protein